MNIYCVTTTKSRTFIEASNLLHAAIRIRFENENLSGSFEDDEIIAIECVAWNLIGSDEKSLELRQ